MDSLKKLTNLINSFNWNEAYLFSFTAQNDIESDLLFTYGEPNKTSEKFEMLRIYLQKNLKDELKARECRRIISDILKIISPYGLAYVSGANLDGTPINSVLEALLDKLDRDALELYNILSLPSGLTTNELIKLKANAAMNLRNTLTTIRRIIDNFQTDRDEVYEVIEKLIRPSLNEAISKTLVVSKQEQKVGKDLADVISNVKEGVMKLLVMLSHPERTNIIADSIKEVFNISIISKSEVGKVETVKIGEQREVAPSCFDWIDSDWEKVLKHPRIYVIIGHRKTGKSAAAHAIVEYLKFKYNLNGYLLNVFGTPIPPKKLSLLPTWMKVINELDEAEKNSVILIDEAYLKFHARTSMREASSRVQTDKLLELSRQKMLSMVFVTQRATKLDKNILEGADTYLIKGIHSLQVQYERSFLRTILEEAYKVLKTVPPDKLPQYVYVYSETDGVSSLKNIGVASYWSEGLSTFYEGF